MLLPRGIVENTNEIYAEIASYPVVPPEKIWQYWNVYTTTFRRLVDPTAYRLENFWWHVWGSDRRNLSGPALAKLFEEFSKGQTFVPLRSTANRYEGPSVPRASRDRLAKLNTQPPEHDKREEAQDRSLPKTSTKPPTPSSSRPPPPHPILKKTRGPSASGARPTARFVSPPVSDDEDEKDGDMSSGSTAVTSSEMLPPPFPPPVKKTMTFAPTEPLAGMPPPPLPSSAKREMEDAPAGKASGLVMRPPPVPSPARSEKSGGTPTRKVVASTAASKRRPALPRRQSSQSSASSDTSSREHPSTMRNLGTQRSVSNVVVEQESSGSSSQASVLMMSSRAAGKRPARSSDKRSTTPRSVPSQGNSSQERIVTTQETVGTLPQRRSTWDMRDPASGGTLVQRLVPAPPIAGFVNDQQPENRPPRMERSHSNIETPRRTREASAGGVGGLAPLQASLVGASIVGTSETTAQGHFDSETMTVATALPEARDIPDGVMLASRPSSSALLDMQFQPTPPNPAPPIPFGRSLSQLTLILEREKARKG
ncbi:hypothetical protein B0H66DRAFT_79112 [Apodospora peruviana]|uniref:Nitrogen regulatory protein areA GATA-like domain-containing protein n=1 Tax=Apodospora peruviana TaxID=516989 RepID=A0AAE0ITZ1_9PEZI|nr:hypothetical protein B0H66DRAFT_79112 [Apodospora peruviana]